MQPQAKGSARPGGAFKYPCGSPGKRCYAIGDVHGRLDLLKQLIDDIEIHNSKRTPRPASIVFLGDLVDRGPDSKGVIEFVRRLNRPGFSLFVICGNHEEMLLRAVNMDGGAFLTWLRSGGRETARSYGVDIEKMSGVSEEAIQRRLADAVPPTHVAFLRSCADSVGFGDYLLTHAGIRPGIAIADQDSRDLRWIRGPFLDSTADHGRMVIHGHSATLKIEERTNRIGIDTGAYQTGVLTAVWLEDDQRGYLQVRGTSQDSDNDLF